MLQNVNVITQEMTWGKARECAEEHLCYYLSDDGETIAVVLQNKFGITQVLTWRMVADVLQNRYCIN